MGLSQAEFETILGDATKTIRGDIQWVDDEDHSPAVEFRVEVVSEAGFPLFIRGSYNRLAQTVTFAMIHRAAGRIYALDLGKGHHNPDCQIVGEKHKHRWNEPVRDKQAYVPDDISASAAEPRAVWQQFCAEAAIVHQGVMHARRHLTRRTHFDG